MRWGDLSLRVMGLMILGCHNALGPNEGLHSTVVLDRVRLIRGDTVQITVTVKDGTLSGSSTCLIGYSVLDGRGLVVAPGDVICTADVVTVSIPPGGLVHRFIWAGYTGSGASGTLLPPGRYKIVGGPGASGQTHRNVSEPVSIELVERPPQ
jgi:hypothetical protein